MSWCSLLQLFCVIFIILFPILWMKYQAFRYWMKLVCYNGSVMATGIWVTPYCLFSPFDVTNLHAVQKFWQFTFKIFGMNIMCRNTNILESDKPMIIVCNHQSQMDLIPMMQIAPRRWSALAKKELMYMGTFGSAAYLAGLVFIDRLNPEKARKTMVETVKVLHDKNMKLWVYPEGTRNMNRGLLSFRKGAFHLAVQAQVPVVPIVFSAYDTWLDNKAMRWDPGTIIATVLPPVTTVGLGSEDVSDLADRVRSQMIEVYERTTSEVDGIIQNGADKEKAN